MCFGERFNLEGCDVIKYLLMVLYYYGNLEKIMKSNKYGQAREMMPLGPASCLLRHEHLCSVAYCSPQFSVSL